MRGSFKENRMRTLKRNKQKIWYATYLGYEDQMEDGLYTGDLVPTYSDPVMLMANVNPASGRTGIEPFGVDTNYTHLMVTDELNLPIDELSVIWFGREPEVDGSPVAPNFRVTRVAKSLNSVTYALEEIHREGVNYE